MACVFKGYLLLLYICLTLLSTRAHPLIVEESPCLGACAYNRYKVQGCVPAAGRGRREGLGARLWLACLCRITIDHAPRAEHRMCTPSLIQEHAGAIKT